MPGAQEELSPVPPDADGLYTILQKYDYLMIRPPLADVDKAIEFSPDALRLNESIMELLKTGKLLIFDRTSDGQISILRIVPET